MRRLAIRLLLFVLAASAACAAQEATARIYGTVYDEQGAVIPDTRIVVTNTGTGVERATATGKDGSFQVLALPIGNYKVRAEHSGFRVVNTAEQKLLINQALRVDIKMPVGAESQSVEVGAQAAPVETVNPTLGQSITGRTLTNMPLNGRDTLDLALLQPGVTESNDDSGAVGNFSIAGGRTDSVTYLLDGGLNNDLLDNSNLLDPNPDAIAEFRLLTSDYTAEYGRNGGGIISVVTKSGTNDIHGSLFEFFRNRVLDANDYFNIQEGLPRADLKRNQYGATLGGPVIKDKTFFFLAYQGQRQIEAEADNRSPVFTTQELTGDFSNSSTGGSPDPGVVAFLRKNPYFKMGNASNGIIDPSKIDPVAQNYIAAGLIPSTPTGLLSTSLDSTDDRDELTGKFDFNLNSKDKLSATIGVNRTSSLNPFPYASFPGFPSLTLANYYFGNIAYTRIFSPTVLNEFHFIAHRSNYLADRAVGNLPSGPSLGIQITPDLTTGPTNLFFDNGLYVGPSENGPTRYIENTYSWTDALSWTRGKHNLKFGAGFSPYQENLVYDYYTNGEFDFYTGTIGTGNPYANFLLGIPDAYYQGALAPSNIRSKSTYLFAQDEWHLSKRLVLTAGLRYEYNTPKTDTQGRTFSVIPGLQSKRFVNAPPGLVFPGDSGAPTGVNFPDKTNFAPRFGFAWDPTGSGKTSVRGGIGVFYDILKGEDNLQFNGQPPFVSNAALYFDDVGPHQVGPVGYLSDPFGSTGSVNPFPSKPPAADVDFTPFLPINNTAFIYLVDPHLRTPYIYQYNLSLQRNLFADTVLEANYVGSSSHGLTSLKDINPTILGSYNRVLDSTCPPQYQDFGCFAQLPEFQNVSHANYNAFEASLTRQPKNSPIGTVYYTFAYTYSHSLDNASGFRQRNYGVPFYDPNYFYASSDSDVRQRISFSGGWDLPFHRLLSTAPKRLTNGWSLYPILSWRTGFPIDISANLPYAYDPGNPGTSGAGDPYFSNVAVIAPIKTYDPHTIRTINVLSYADDGSGNCQITSTPVTGNFIFDPNSFSNLPLENNPYYDNENPCFPEIDPVNNPADRTYGLHRNTLRGPSRTNLDLTLAKATAINERFNLEFRADFFNLLNHTQFAQPTYINGTTNVDSLNFGLITTTGTYRTAGPRIGQLALRLTF